MKYLVPFKKPNLGNLFKALLCSVLNLLILLIIYLFITKFSQGFVIPLDLYMRTDFPSFALNIVIFHFLLSFLALIMTLYPTYIFAFLFERGKKKYYSSDKKGLIFYKYTQAEGVEDQNLNDTESYVRKILGISLFIIWTWVIVYVYNKHQISIDHIYLLISFAICTSILLLVFFLHLHKLKNSGPADKKVFWQNFADLSFRWYIPYFLLANGILCFAAWIFEWHLVTVFIQLIICFLLGAHLILLRTFRKSIQKISDIINYLQLHRILGIVTIIFIVLINSWAQFAESINPINMILAYLIAIYTIITMLFKWYLFLKYRDKNGDENYIPLGFGKLKIQGYRYLILAFILYFIWNSKQANNLHELNLLDKKEAFQQKSIEQFCLDFQKARQIEDTPIFYAAYGGGLKANYWNFQILEELEKKKQFQNIVAMSGVSGGGMGIGLFTASKYLDLSEQERTELITKVKSANILGIELSWLLGYDYFRSMLPLSKGLGKGRAFRSTKYYTNLLDPTKLSFNTSFEKVYHELSDNKHYPNVIFNSTAAADKYGVASAINTPKMFPASINILDIEDKTLGYFEAISTCNRFPIISPAADIPTKGYFLDGGYYENSGIMSLASFANAIEVIDNTLASDTSRSDYKAFMNNTLNLVTVSNTKLNYLQFILRNAGEDYAEISNKEIIQINNNTEVQAILSGAIELDRMPHYIRSVVEEYEKEKYNIIDISLPYYFQIDTLEQKRDDDINKLFKGTLKPKVREKVYKILSQSNQSIKETLTEHAPEYKISSWGIVEPPTARILSKPVEIYMEAMMKHPYVQSQLKLVTQ